MDAYKQIAEINSAKTEREFIEYAEETFGKLPLEVTNLISIAVVKVLAMKLGVSKITVTKEEVSLEFLAFTCFKNQKLVDAIESSQEKILVSMEKNPKIKFEANGRGNSTMLYVIRRFLDKTRE